MAPITAIEFTESECRIVQGERARDKASIRELAAFELTKNENAPERIAERAKLLRETLRQRKIKAQGVNVIIPKNVVMTRMVTLPSIEDAEIANMIRFEAERHIPFNAERHIISHWVLAKLGVGGSKVLVAAIDQPVVQEFVDICAQAGLTVQSVEVSSLALFNGFAFSEHEALNDKVVTIVNIGVASTDVVIAANGLLSFARSGALGIGKLIGDVNEADPRASLTASELHRIDALEPHHFFHPPPGMNLMTPAYGTPSLDLNPGDVLAPGNAPGPVMIDGTTGDPVITPAAAAMPENKGAQVFTQWLLRLLQEIRRTYEYARREFSCPLIDHIYVCGEGAQLQNLSQYLKVNFGIESSLYEPLRKLEISAKARQEIGGRAIAFGTIAGAVAPVAAHQVRVSLLPVAYSEKRRSKRQQQSYIVTAAMALVALVLTYMWVKDTFERLNNQLSDYRGKNVQMRDRVEDLKDRQLRVNLLRQNVSDKHGALDILEAISKFPFIPKDVTLKRFEYKKGEEVRVVGNAKQLADANKMEQALRDTKFFENVAQDKSSYKPEKLPGRGDATVLEYAIVCTFPKRDAKKAAKPAAAKEATGEAE